MEHESPLPCSQDPSNSPYQSHLPIPVLMVV